MPGSDEKDGLARPELEPQSSRAAELAKPQSAPALEGDLFIDLELRPSVRSPDFAPEVERSFVPSGVAADDFLPGVGLRFGPFEVRRVFEPAEETLVERSATGPASGLDRHLLLRFPAGTPGSDVRAMLMATPEVARAAIVRRPRPPGVSDPFVGAKDQVEIGEGGFQNQWYLHRINAPGAWRRTRGKGVVVADLDWGFRVSHHELHPGITRRFNAVDGGEDVAGGDRAYHGTAVLGLAGARANGAGMSGAAPEVELWAVMCDGPEPYLDHWIAGLSYVRRQAEGRRVVVIFEVETSIGGNFEQYPSIARAVRDTIAAGCVVCVAAGNGARRADISDDGESFEPTGSILVAATTYAPDANPRADFSNFGPSVDICAPGDPEFDLTCGHSGDARFRNDFGGTSGAAPKVAGVAALMLAVNPALSHAEIRQILIATGNTPESPAHMPIGRFLDADAAVAEASRRRG